MTRKNLCDMFCECFPEPMGVIKKSYAGLGQDEWRTRAEVPLGYKCVQNCKKFRRFLPKAKH